MFREVRRAEACGHNWNGFWTRKGQSWRPPKFTGDRIDDQQVEYFSTVRTLIDGNMSYSGEMRFSYESLHLSSAQDGSPIIEPAVPDVDRLCGREDGTTR